MTNQHPYEIGHYVLVTHPDSLMTPSQPCEVVKVLKSGEYVVAQDGYAETWAGEWLQPENTWGIRVGYVAPPEPYSPLLFADYLEARRRVVGELASPDGDKKDLPQLISEMYAEMHRFLFYYYDFTPYADDNESEPDND